MMDHADVRRHVILALFSDPVLLDQLVLKGGNALALVHDLLDRASLDIDVSLERDFEDPADVRRRLSRALKTEFGRQELIVFDFSFLAVPPALSEDRKSWWGGYRLQFKIISEGLYRRFRADPAALRRRARTVNSYQGRTITVDISRGEWCAGKIRTNIAGRNIYVYSEEMCVVEKLRAICQQQTSYATVLRSPTSARARDFYDIYTVVSRRGLDLTIPENLNMFRLIFEAKRVPLTLLREIRGTQNFHEQDWPAVEALIPGRAEPFSRYFEFTAELAEIVAGLLDDESERTNLQKPRG